MPVTKRLIALCSSLPITESCGPVMPASVIAAVPPGEHACVGGLHVRVRSEHRRDAAVEVARERDLLARRLGVEVDDDDGRRAPRLLDEAVGGEERALERIEREDPEQVDHRDTVVHREAAAGRPRRHVRGSQDAVGAREVRREVLLPPGPVAERHDVGAAREQLVGELRGDAASGRCVLAVDDAEVDAELLAERRQAHLDGATTRSTEHVGDEQDANSERFLVEAERRGGMHLDRDVVPGVVRVARSDWCSACVKSTTEPSFVAAAESCEPTTSAGIDLDVRDRHDERRRAGRLDVDARPERAPVDHDLVDREHGAVDGRVHVGAGGSADVDATTSTVPARRAAGTSGASRSTSRRSRGRRACSTPSFACVPSGESAERAGGAALVADRRHARLARPGAGGAASRGGRRLRGTAARQGAGARRSPESAPARLSRRRRTRTRAARRARRRRSRARRRGGAGAAHAPGAGGAYARTPVGAPGASWRAP